MSGTKKYFTKWYKENRKLKIINEARKTFEMFEKLTEVFTQNTALVLQNPRETAYLQFALDRIFGNCKANTEHAFRLWRKMTAEARANAMLNEEKKKELVSMLSAFANNSSLGMLKEANDAFLKNSQETEMKKKFLTKLLTSKSGRSVLVFNLWKSLPLPSDDLKRKLANRFERGLSNFAVKMMKYPLKQFS
jgi:hypothetical protein